MMRTRSINALTAFRIVLCAAAALITTHSARAEQPAQFNAASFVDALRSGAYWCVEPRRSDNTCRFIEYMDRAQLVQSERSVTAVAFFFRAETTGARYKQVNFYRFVLDGDWMCERVTRIKVQDSLFFTPGADKPEITAGDEPFAPEKEATFQKRSHDLRTARGDKCWSYRYQERNSNFDGPEIVMTLRNDDGEQDWPSYGRFFTGEEAAQLRLR